MEHQTQNSAIDPKPELCVCILAAGRGTRMNSSLPKVLHRFKDRAMVDYVIETADALTPRSIVIITGFEALAVEQHIHDAFPTLPIQFARQRDQKGTADALACLFPFFKENSPHLQPPYLDCSVKVSQNLNAESVLVLLGDTPRLKSDGLQKFCKWFYSDPSIDLAVLSTEIDDPTGYGRVSENLENGTVTITEEKEATSVEKLNKCINTGIFLAKTKALFTLLKDVKPSERTGEYYATDIFSLAKKHSFTARRYIDENYQNFVGINTVTQLNQAEIDAQKY